MRQTSAILFQGVRQRRIGIVLPVLHQFCWVAAKVFEEPNVDTRYLELTVLDRHAARMVNELASAFFQQRFTVFTGVTDWLQVRTAQTRAVERVMNSIVFPDRPENPVFDVVERKLFAFYGYQLRTPRSACE